MSELLDLSMKVLAREIDSAGCINPAEIQIAFKGIESFLDRTEGSVDVTIAKTRRLAERVYLIASYLNLAEGHPTTRAQRLLGELPFEDRSYLGWSHYENASELAREDGLGAKLGAWRGLNLFLAFVTLEVIAEVGPRSEISRNITRRESVKSLLDASSRELDRSHG